MTPLVDLNWLKRCVERGAAGRAVWIGVPAGLPSRPAVALNQIGGGAP